MENDPDGVMQLKGQGRPKTKKNPDQTIEPKTKHVKNESKQKNAQIILHVKN